MRGRRWRRAQAREMEFWRKKKEVVLSSGYREEMKARARRIGEWLGRISAIKGNSNILEVGGGGTQLIDYFPEGRRYAVDPLAGFYLREFSPVLNSEVRWLAARAEDLPFPDNFFDILISRNVLDHLESPRGFLGEAKRTLKEGGIFYLGLNTLSGPLYLFRKIKKSGEHPFVFSRRRVERLIKETGFRIAERRFDAPENMRDFNELAFESNLRNLLHRLLLFLRSYHFCEFILKK